MSGAEQANLLSDTTRTTGKDAIKKNIAAAIAVSDAIRSTLGPDGLDKMLVRSSGDAFVTNEGVTVLTEANVEHPAAKMIISSALNQNNIQNDGTTTMVLLVGELLQNAWELIAKGIHPTTIIEGYKITMNQSIEHLDDISKEIKSENDKISIINTALSGRGTTDVKKHISELAINNAKSVIKMSSNETIFDSTLLKIVKDKNGSAMDTWVLNGLVVAKQAVHPKMDTNVIDGKILLIDGGIEHKELAINASLKITTAGMIEEFKKQEVEKIKSEVEKISKLGINILVCKDGICDEGIRELEKSGIIAYRRVEKRDLELLAKATGATIANSTDTCSKSHIGNFKHSRQEKWGNVNQWIIEGTIEKGITLIAKGSSTQILEIIEEIFTDAIKIACNLESEGRILPGGGGSYTSCSRKLKSLNIQDIGREQLAIDAFAAALEIVPMTLAQNSGMNGLDEMLNLISSQSRLSADDLEKSNWLGLNLATRNIENTLDNGILDSSSVVIQSIKSSTETATTILRIDDVLWARQDPTVPDEIQQSLEND